MKRPYFACGGCGRKGAYLYGRGAAEYFYVRCRCCKREKAYSRLRMRDYPGVEAAAAALAALPPPPTLDPRAIEAECRRLGLPYPPTPAVKALAALGAFDLDVKVDTPREPSDRGERRRAR